MAAMHYWTREPDTPESVQYRVDQLSPEDFYGMLANYLLFVAHSDCQAFYANGAQTENAMQFHAMARRLAREQKLDISESESQVQNMIFNRANPGHNVVELPCPKS